MIQENMFALDNLFDTITEATMATIVNQKESDDVEAVRQAYPCISVLCDREGSDVLEVVTSTFLEGVLDEAESEAFHIIHNGL